MIVTLLVIYLVIGFVMALVNDCIVEICYSMAIKKHWFFERIKEFGTQDEIDELNRFLKLEENSDGDKIIVRIIGIIYSTIMWPKHIRLTINWAKTFFYIIKKSS